MKRLPKIWDKLKLNTKFSMIIVVMVGIPIIIFTVFFYWNMTNSVFEEKSRSTEYELKESYAQILKNVDSINMSTQFFISDQALMDFLTDLKEGKEPDISSLRKFYSEDIASLERLVNNNPYLYQVRVYADHDNMQEMMPILYRQKRMESLAWAKENKEEWEGWHFDYKDTLFDSFVIDQGRSIMSYVTRMEVYGSGEIGIVEVAMRMETMFPHLYDGTDTEWYCFVDNEGNCYLGNSDTQLKREQTAQILENIEPDKQTDVQVKQLKVNGTPFVVGSVPVKELSGTWIIVSNMSGEMAQIHNQQVIFILGMVGVLVVLIFLVNLVVKRVLRQFYEIMDSIREVQKGDLNVVVKSNGSDEMAELGTQINKMLSRIRQLMEENLSRERLAKNSQIKALQNQINAHFTYNVLESVKMMAEIDEEYEISDAITRFGRLLRYSMNWGNGNVTVQKELDYIRDYLVLINLRFDYEIYLSENLPDIILEQEIPKMTLQPIVENAIYHGIEQMAEDTNIYIKGIVEDSVCTIEITDAGNGMSEETLQKVRSKLADEIEESGGDGIGIGLKNVQDRIRMSFGEDYGLEIASRLGCYTKVTMKIPLTHSTTEQKEDREQEK
ncbi:MAG: sensor histidine kinase [Lachnospiraceae bacterium]